MGVRCTTTASAGTGYVVLGLTTAANTVNAQVYALIPSAPGGNTTIAALRTASTTAVSVMVSALGKIVLLNTASGTITGVDSTYTFPWNTKVRIRVKGIIDAAPTTGNGTLLVEIYHGESSTASFTFSSATQNLGTTQLQSIRAGIVGAPTLTGFVVDIDDLYINDTGVDRGSFPSGSAAFTVANVMTATGKRVAGGTAAFTVSNVLTAAGKRVAGGVAAFTNAVALTATGKRVPKGAASFPVTNVLTASGVAPGVAMHSGSATFTVASSFTATGEAPADTGTRPPGPLTLTLASPARALTVTAPTRTLTGTTPIRTLTVEEP
jgi:hypothetical protein